MQSQSPTDFIELTILMPCLNEAETLAICIQKAQDFLNRSGVAGEVLIADNGSTDGSIAIAEAHGARVAHIPQKGYGAALIGGIQNASGRFVIMGDADDSYDFKNLMPFVEKLRTGADIVIGNRFKGGIEPGAMPFLHKYLGNPVLSMLGRIFFDIDIGDFHCGLRGFNRTRIASLELSTPGMEFASEMIVRASLAKFRIEEVPTTLKKDGRSRPPHLRTWRDGWRHLRFLLVHTPRWLFLYPGLFFIIAGMAGAGALSIGPVSIGKIGLSIHTFLAACMSILIGIQLVTYSLISRQFSVLSGYIPPPARFNRMLDTLSVEKILTVGALLLVGGIVGTSYCLAQWSAVHFGDLAYGSLEHVLMISLTCIVAGIQVSFTAFLSAIMSNGISK